MDKANSFATSNILERWLFGPTETDLPAVMLPFELEQRPFL